MKLDKFFFIFSDFFSVAFHATITSNFPINVNGEKVKFDGVKLNTGNGYKLQIYFVSNLCLNENIKVSTHVAHSDCFTAIF